MIGVLLRVVLPAAIAGGTMAVALSCCPSFAFTLSSAFTRPVRPSRRTSMQVYYDHYNNSYRVPSCSVPKTSPYDNAYHHPYHP